jgi:hypothetical protein
MNQVEATEPALEEIGRLIGEVRRTGIEFAYNGELLFLGVTSPTAIPGLERIFESSLGRPYKERDRRALWMNFFERFVRDVGGIRRNQTLYRRPMGDSVTLYAALWPWATRPDKVSVRIGLHCRVAPVIQQLNAALLAIEERPPDAPA